MEDPLVQRENGQYLTEDGLHLDRVCSHDLGSNYSLINNIERDVSEEKQ